MREAGRLSAVLLPLTVSDGDAGVTRAGAGAACVARGLVVPLVSGVAEAAAGADAVPELLLLVLLVLLLWLLRLPPPSPPLFPVL
jgi:hypothetical protein